MSVLVLFRQNDRTAALSQIQSVKIESFLQKPFRNVISTWKKHRFAERKYWKKEKLTGKNNRCIREYKEWLCQNFRIGSNFLRLKVSPDSDPNCPVSNRKRQFHKRRFRVRPFSRFLLDDIKKFFFLVKLVQEKKTSDFFLFRSTFFSYSFSITFQLSRLSPRIKNLNRNILSNKRSTEIILLKTKTSTDVALNHSLENGHWCLFT